MVSNTVLKGCGIGVVKWGGASRGRPRSNEGHRLQNQGVTDSNGALPPFCLMSSAVTQRWGVCSPRALLKMKHNNIYKSLLNTQQILALLKVKHFSDVAIFRWQFSCVQTGTEKA